MNNMSQTKYYCPAKRDSDIVSCLQQLSKH